MTHEFIFKDSFMDLTKTHIRETQTNEEVLLHPKWSFPIGKYLFFLEKKNTREYLQKRILFTTPLLCTIKTERNYYELKMFHS